MTPSRPTAFQTSHRRRTRLLVGSALCGVAALLAQPGLAQTLPGIPGGGGITVSAGGSAPVITAPDPNTLDIDLNASRTVINWSSLHVSGADEMMFHFDSASDIVLNKTTSQIAIDTGGKVTGLVGASAGGNIWFYSPQGVIVSPGAVMSAGGFLFSRGESLVDSSFVAAADPLANLRGVTDAFIQMTTIGSATTASINSTGDVVLSSTSGNLVVDSAVGKTATLSTVSNSITVDEVAATAGAAQVLSGGSGATITGTITGATGVRVSSNNNTSVRAAVTSVSGDITILSNGSASLTSGNAKRDVIMTAPTLFISTADAGRDFIATGTTGTTVTIHVFAGDDIEITANGNINAAGAYLRSTGAGATDDAHILVRSLAGSATANIGWTEGTGVAAGDITISAATSANVNSADSSRDLNITGASARTTSASAARDLVMIASAGNATVSTTATAGDDVEITANGGDVLAGGAALTATGVGATDDAHVQVVSTTGSLDLGTVRTQGTGAAAGNITLSAADAFTASTAQSTRDVYASATNDVTLGSATAGREITVISASGQAVLGAATLTGSGSGHDLVISASGDAVLGDVDYTAITAANVFSRTGGNTGGVLIQSANGDAMAHLDTTDAIDTMDGAGVDVTILSGPATFDSLVAHTDDLYVEALDGTLTVGSATAVNGDLDLFSAGGGLTVTGAVYGAGDVHLETDGLLDGTAASLIASDGDLELSGGDVDVGHVTAAGVIEASAFTGNAVVQLAEAGSTVMVAAVDGDATLRAASGPDGVTVLAMDKATLGADDKASITTANYVLTNASCGCGTDGVQVLSFDGDAVVNINTASNGITLVGAAIDGSATVVQKVGDLKVDEVAAYNITLEAMDGTLETGSTTLSGGDYSITAQDFLGDALTPNLFFGENHDVAITDTLGDLDLGTTSLHVGHALSITASDGAVTGLAQLDAGTGVGDGSIQVTADAITLDTVRSDGAVSLDGGLGLVNLVTSLSVDGDYSLAGGSFTDVALTPLGTKSGLWTVRDRVGDFNFTGKTLTYGGSVDIGASAGRVIGGNVTSDAGSVTVAGRSGAVGALHAGGGDISATASAGGMTVTSADAAANIEVKGTSGVTSLGSANLRGTGANSLVVQATSGNVLLGAATPGAIGSTHAVTSAGATTTVTASTGVGLASVNLDHLTGADLTTVSGSQDVAIRVVNGALRVGEASSTNRGVAIDGPDGVLTVDRLVAGGNSRVSGGGETRLVSALVTGDLAVSSATGGLRFGDATPGRVIDLTGQLSLNAATDVTQEGVFRANALGVIAGTGVVLLGDNEISYLDTIGVSSGGFAFHDTLGFDLYGPIIAFGQTVDLRSDQAIGQASTGIITAETLTGSSVGSALFGAANEVVRLGDFTNTGGLFKLVDTRSLTVDGTVLSTGAVALTSHGGMTFAGTGRVQADGTGNAVVLASDGTFTNARGSDAVTASNAAGRWLIYTQAVGAPLGSTAANSLGGLAGKSFYGSAYDFLNEVLAVTPNAGNRFVYAYRPTLTVTPNGQTVTYNGGVPTTSASITGLVNGDLAADAWSGAAAVSGATSKTVGTYTLTASVGTLASDLNYAFTYGTGTLRIDPKALTAALDADDKTYDRTTNATGAVVLTGVVAGDAVSAAGTYAFADRNAGVGKTVTASGVTLSGADAGNYSLSSVAAGTADIAQKGVTGALTANDKTYDGSAAATGSVGLTGVIAGDAVTASGTYAFADKLAAAGKTVTVSGATLAGADAANYSLGAVAGDTADIFRKTLTGVLAANTRTYDGTTVATGTIGLTGVVTGDTVGAAGTYAFADKTAQAGKTVTASGVALSGADAGNYTLTPVGTATADILKKGLTGALTANNKTYDGATSATGTIGLTGVVAGDTVSAAGTYAFADKTAANGKTVTASAVALSGADAGNYTLAPVGTTTASILRKALTGTLTAGAKTYDGTAAASGSISLTGVVAGDVVTASGAYAFADGNAGVGKTVTATGSTLAGGDAANYTLGAVSTALADILRRAVTVTADNQVKTFGEADPALSYRITSGGLVAGDTFTGGLARRDGEVPDAYAIGQGTLALSANYNLTFTGAVFTIDPLPTIEYDGASALKYLNQSPSFSLDGDPAPNLTTDGAACTGDSCQTAAATTTVVASR